MDVTPSAVDALFAVQYRLKDAKDYVFNTRNPDDVLVQVATTAISEVVGRNKMDFALYEGRAQIAAETEKLMQAMLDRYGTEEQKQKYLVPLTSGESWGAWGLTEPTGSGSSLSTASSSSRTPDSASALGGSRRSGPCITRRTLGR